MQKVNIVLKAITRAGLDPLDFTIYAQRYVKPVILAYQPGSKQGGIVNTAPIMIDYITSLEVHPDDGIKLVTREIIEKFANL